MGESAPSIQFITNRTFPKSQTKRLFFLGMKHSGKSSLAQRTADKLGWIYKDSDDAVLDLLNGTYASVRDFYRSEGKQSFMSAENQAVQGLLSTAGPCCIALGGGACDNADLIHLCSSSGVMIFLDTPPQPIYERIMKGGIPPFLSSEDPWESFLEMYEYRSLMYMESADIHFSLEEASLEKVTDWFFRKLTTILTRYYGR